MHPPVAISFHLDKPSRLAVRLSLEDQIRRRLIRPFVLALLSKKLRIGGVLHVATDVEVYADHVSKVLFGSSKALEDLHDGDVRETAVRWEGGEASERPSWRPVTNYERKAIEAGRRVRDFSYRLIRDDVVDDDFPSVRSREKG